MLLELLPLEIFIVHFMELVTSIHRFLRVVQEIRERETRESKGLWIESFRATHVTPRALVFGGTL